MGPIETRFEIRRYGREVKTHTHPHHQVIMPLQGALEMEIDGRGGAASGGVAALVTAGTRHSNAHAPGGAFLIVDIPEHGTSGSLCNRRIWDAAAARPFLRVDQSVSSLSAFLAGEIERYGHVDLNAAAAGDLLIDALGRRMDVGGARLDDRLTKVLRFVEIHLDEAITVDCLAAAAGLSAGRLHALFRAHFGTSPKRYVAARRLNYAARLLARSERPISQIALDAGYGDQSAFARAFKQAHAQSPARYRRDARAHENRHKIQ